MKILRLKIVRGHQCGEEFVLEPGQSAVIGRSASVQVCVSQDALISSQHAQVEFTSDGSGRISDLGSMNGTFVNGSRVSSTGLLDGDLLRLGKTEWIVSLGSDAAGTDRGLKQAAGAPAGAGGTVRDIAITPTPRHGAEEFSRIVPRIADVISGHQSVEILVGMRDEIADDMRTTDWVRQLLSKKREQEALAVLAYALINPSGIWWACQVIRGLNPNLTEEDNKRLRLAEMWVKEREERHCREAFAAAEANQMASASAWACVAAFWSGDNIAPANAPAMVKPGPDLAAKAIAAAIQLCVASVPEQSNSRNAYAAELGLKVALGELTWS